MSSSIGEPYLLLSTTCYEILSWMIGISMNFHFVSDSMCTIINLQSLKISTRNDNNVGLTFSVGDNIPRFIISVEQGN